MCTNDDYKNGKWVKIAYPWMQNIPTMKLLPIVSAYLKKSECILEKAMSEQSCKTHYDKLITFIQDPTSGSELCW